MSIPNLQDLIFDRSTDKHFNKNNFIKYLASIHCLENFEFLVDVNKFYQLSNDTDRIYKWNLIIKHYLLTDSLKEINIPHQMRNNLLTKNHLPHNDCIKKAYKIISELVLDNYNQFIGMIKKQQQDRKGGGEVSRNNSIVERRGSATSERRGSLTLERKMSVTMERRNSVLFERRGSTSTSHSSGVLSSLVYGNNNSSSSNNSIPHSTSRRPSVIEYPKSPINNATVKQNTITKLPSPQLDIERKKSKNSSMFKMKKFKFRRNSNEA